MHHPYVVITPDYMVYTADFSKLIEQHIQSEADITLLYHAVDNAKDAYLNCNILNLNKQKGVLSIEPNHGNAKNRQYFHGHLHYEEGSVYRADPQGKGNFLQPLLLQTLSMSCIMSWM